MYSWPADLSEQQISFFGQIQTSQTGGQPFSDTSLHGESLFTSLLVIVLWMIKLLKRKNFYYHDVVVFNLGKGSSE